MKIATITWYSTGVETSLETEKEFIAEGQYQDLYDRIMREGYSYCGNDTIEWLRLIAYD